MKQLMMCVILLCISVGSGCANSQSMSQSMSGLGTGTGTGPDLSVGYFSAHSEALPNGKVLLPAPPRPDPGLPAFAADQAINLDTFKLRGTKRWELAAQDADLKFPAAAGTFACALGVAVTEKDTPHLYTLLHRSLADAAHSADSAKGEYRRLRPLAVNGQPSCTPNDEPFLRGSWSYPSGHATIGWAWALILSEVAPDRIDALLARGLAFGQSRVICNAHWQSDVNAGRIMGAGSVAALHNNGEFRKDLEAAQKEVAEARNKGLQPQRDCAAEAAALAEH
ncbi:acid phosphatase [Geomesophilobacter sediminis]|uniref:Acid phosphatase n=1 Tax=Geomesophilobacter sediminis TaxID=2798584 RepID=A0A8J7IN84_9BACT|nr:phosphatase PAP2 family protein [Geomesophilobacter sediminis]MBJ6723439.1 phosphatase PAP2 family protein [Geomesophilobacter sediminis]